MRSLNRLVPLGGKLRCRRTIIHPGSISSLPSHRPSVAAPELLLSLRIHFWKSEHSTKGTSRRSRKEGEREGARNCVKVHFKKKAGKKRARDSSSSSSSSAVVVGLNPPPPPLPPLPFFLDFFPYQECQVSCAQLSSK